MASSPDLLERQRILKEEGKIALHRRVTRQRFAGDPAQLVSVQAFEIEFGKVNILTQFAGGSGRGVELAELCNRFAVHYRPGRSPGMVIFGGPGVIEERVVREEMQQGFKIALQIKER